MMRRWQKIVQSTPFRLCVMAAAVALLYGHVVRAPFHFDDIAFIKNNTYLQRVSDLRAIWGQPYSRLNFFTFVSFAINYHLGKWETLGYHLVNIGLHLVNGILVFFVARWILTLADHRKRLSASEIGTLAFGTAMIFLVHPVQVHSVTYIWSRSELLSGLFSLLAVVMYLKARVERQGWWFLAASVMAMIGLFSRGNNFILPLIVLLIESVCFGGGWMRRVSWRRLGLAVVGLGIIGGIAGLAGPAVLRLLSMDWVFKGEFTPLVYALNQPQVVFRYIGLCLWPFGLSLDHHVLFYANLLSPRVIGPLVALVAVFAGVIVLYRRDRLLGAGPVWFFIWLIPVSTVFPLVTVMAESRLYMPMFGFALCAMTIMMRIKVSAWARHTLTVGVVFFLALVTTARNYYWQDSFLLLEDVVRRYPNYARPYLGLGNLYEERGDHETALRCFHRVLALEPRSAEALNNIGIIWIKKKDYQKAEVFFVEAVAANPDFLNAHINLGNAMILSGKYDDAREVFRRAVVKGAGAWAHAGIGVANFRMGRLKEAQDSLTQAVVLDPKNFYAILQLAHTCVAQNDIVAARWMYETAAKLEPENYTVAYNLGRVYLKLGLVPWAELSFLRAAKVRPGTAAPYIELARLSASRGEMKKFTRYMGEVEKMAHSSAVDDAGDALPLFSSGVGVKGY